MSIPSLANLLLCGSGFFDLSGKQPIYECRATYVNQNVLEIETISSFGFFKLFSCFQNRETELTEQLELVFIQVSKIRPHL